MFQIGMPLDQDWGRVAGRENVGLVKKDGVPRLSRQGSRVRADLTRRGKVLYRVETEVLDSPAHPMLWHRETGFGAFLYRYRLDPDWRRGPLGPDPVELWLRVLGGKRGVYPQEMVEGAPRECDVDRTQFATGRAVAARSLRGVSAARDRRRELSRDRPPPAGGSHAPRGEDRDPHRAAADDRSEALRAVGVLHVRPADHGGKGLGAGGLAEGRTAMKLSPEELDRYRRRDALALELRDLVQVDLRVSPELHARTAAARSRSGAEPLVRILALDVSTSDVSTQPFHELWLFARCLREGREAWYALSHLVGPDGDVVFGRETFGYPSRMAAIEWSRDGDSFAIAASRLGRRVVDLAAASSGGVGARTGAPQSRSSASASTRPIA